MNNFIFRVTDILVAPIMLNDVKEFLREKKIDYVILISDLQVFNNSLQKSSIMESY
jgi:hypothetical protein